jgi:hypothetical protein
MANIRDIVADNELVDLITRIDGVRADLEKIDTADQARHGLALAEDALHVVTYFLVRLREQRLGL